jgi:hypothetical protein
VLDGVGEVDLRSVEADAVERLGEHPARGPDERLARLVLLVAGLLADQQQPGVAPPSPNTVCVAASYSSQRVQCAASCRRESKVSATGYGYPGGRRGTPRPCKSCWCCGRWASATSSWRCPRCAPSGSATRPTASCWPGPPRSNPWSGRRERSTRPCRPPRRTRSRGATGRHRTSSCNLHGVGRRATAPSTRRARATHRGARTRLGRAGLGRHRRAHRHERERWCAVVEAFGVCADPTDLALDGRVPDAGTARGGPPRRGLRRQALARRPVRRRRHGWSARAAGWSSPGRAPRRGSPGRCAERAGLPADRVLAGRTDIAGLMDVVARRGLWWCGDTGIAHLATALGTTVGRAVRPGPPDRWGPPEGGPHVVLTDRRPPPRRPVRRRPRPGVAGRRCGRGDARGDSALLAATPVTRSAEPADGHRDGCELASDRSSSRAAGWQREPARTRRRPTNPAAWRTACRTASGHGRPSASAAAEPAREGVARAARVADRDPRRGDRDRRADRPDQHRALRAAGHRDRLRRPRPQHAPGRPAPAAAVPSRPWLRPGSASPRSRRARGRVPAGAGPTPPARPPAPRRPAPRGPSDRRRPPARSRRRAPRRRRQRRLAAARRPPRRSRGAGRPSPRSTLASPARRVLTTVPPSPGPPRRRRPG